MSRSTPVALLAFLLARWSQMSCGATLQERMMRNEKVASDKAIQLMPNGLTQTETRLAKDDTGFGTGDGDADNPEEYCDYDFPWGIENSSKCDSRAMTNESNLEKDECIYAAEKAGAVTHESNFNVDQSWQDVRPIGCFMFPCDNGKKCYFHNADGDEPRGHLTGVPVCKRFMYHFGQAEKNAFANDTRICQTCEDGTCHNNPEYSAAIITEAQCRKIAQCLGHPEGADFVIGENTHDMRDEMDYPQGCFYHASETHNISGKEVFYFNPLTSGIAPTSPTGTPICKVIHPQQVR